MQDTNKNFIIENSLTYINKTQQQTKLWRRDNVE